MKSPKLNDIYEPPAGKSGWPWTEATPPQPERMPGGGEWPRISIVTPSFNQGQFIEETIRSVLLQGYPNLEYIVMDGGSKDGSVGIIKKYAPWLAHWESQPDRGQSHAINKGFAKSTGDIMGWLNSDDILLPHALFNIATAFQKTNCDICSGHTLISEKLGCNENRYKVSKINVETLLYNYTSVVAQPSTFWLASIWKECGPLRNDIHFCMDYDLWLRFASRGTWNFIDINLAWFRRHDKQKTFAPWHCKIELRRVIEEFKLSEYYSPEYFRALKSALFYEGWIKYWVALYRVQPECGHLAHWLKGPLYNFRCLFMFQYFRIVGGAIKNLFTNK